MPIGADVSPILPTIFVMLNKLIIRLLILLALPCAFAGGAYAQCSTVNNVVPAGGETLKFNAYFNWGAIWVKGAEAVFKAEPSGNFFHYKVTASTMPKWRWIYDLNTTIEAYMDRNTMKPVSFASNTTEDGKVKHETISYAGNKLKYETWGVTKDSLFSAEVDHPDCSYDLLNAVYAARNVDYSQFRFGEPIQFNVFFTNEMSTLTGEVIGREKVKTRNGKTYDCLKCKSNSIPYSIFDPKQPVYIWITNEPRHIPVKVECKIKLGYIKVYLDE